MIIGPPSQFDFTADDVRESLTRFLGEHNLENLVWLLRRKPVLIPAVDGFYGVREAALVDEEDQAHKRTPKWFVFTVGDRFFRLSTTGRWTDPEKVVLDEISDPAIPDPEPEETDSDMSFTLDEVRRAVSGFADTSEAWAGFRRALLKDEAVLLHGVGHAQFVEETEAEYDSYDDFINDRVNFVFKIGDRHFRKHGVQSSYEGVEWSLDLEEVKAMPVPKTIWQAV